jgi:uncharacterized YigZ family protein
MKTVLDTSDRPAHDALVEKKSEFIADVCHVDALDEALLFVDSVRQLHPKARHVAYAAICVDGDGRVRERMSDDGEPSGTAGKPILDVLRANEMTDCVVAVTRYFGGILLGSGGLIRAYSTGASIAVKAASKAKIVPCGEYQVTLDYPQLGSFQNLLSTVEGEQTDAQYTDRIALTVVVPQEQANVFESRVVETFNATVVPQLVGTSNRPVKV